MTMKLAAVFFFFFCYLIRSSEGFFNGDVSTLVNKTINRLNLTCYYYGDLVGNNEYCFYQSFSNGSSSAVFYDYVPIMNIYRTMSQRCTGFSNSTDIGYGPCSPLPFELFTQSILCICATDMCNVNLTTCQTSVDYQLRTNSAPAVLRSMIPQLEKPISCADSGYPSNDTSYCVELASPFIDIAKCKAYTAANTVLCMVHVSNGVVYPLAITRDYYAYYLSGMLDRVNRFNRDPSRTLVYNETDASFYLNFNVTELTAMNTSATVVVQRCFCLANNCNGNLTTCLSASRKGRAPRNAMNIGVVFFIYALHSFFKF